MAQLPRRARGRHNEIVRQWEIIRTLEESAHGKSLRALAEQLSVTQRTIRRDLEVIERAGFMLDQISVGDERRWILKRDFFSGVAARGFTLSEMCALYFSRSLLESFGGAPFHEDLTRAFDKIENALPPGLWRYIDQLPAVLASKGDRPKKRGTNVPAYLARLTDAVLDHKRVVMQYESFSSQAIKEYRIEPHRLLYGQGGLYLHAFVPTLRRDADLRRRADQAPVDARRGLRSTRGRRLRRVPALHGRLQRPARTRRPRVHGQDGALCPRAGVAPDADRRQAA